MNGTFRLEVYDMEARQMTPQEAYSQLKERMSKISVLGSTAAVLYWDQEAYLPKKAFDHRGEQLAQLGSLRHEWFTDPQVGEWLAATEGSELVKDRETEAAVNVREWRRLYDRVVKLPKEFVEDFTRTTTKASQVWAEARKKSDFSLFAPLLEKIVELCRRKADLIGFKTEAYDVLLDEYEPGATTAEVEQVFTALRPELVELIGKIAGAPRKPDLGILRKRYDIDKQRLFCESLAAAQGYDFAQGRIDESVHPSCNGLGPYDTRVLTRYYLDDLAEGITGITHEVGHSLYDIGHPDKTHWGTPMGECASLAIHESLSRMWENIVGRSREYLTYFYPQLQRIFREELAEVSLEDFYGAMNFVAPSYIRVQADEATYNLHIMLRFELERAMIRGDLKVKDIPGEWNRRFRDYLGIEVDNDANGCLQDVHWSHGIHGYFPTYALGNLCAAQFYARAQSDLPGLLQDFAQGDFSRLLGWLTEKIHSRGFKYYSPELCERVTGKALSHRPLIDYLYGKYGEIYGITR
ncbi:MAG: carboxypeptidase M32 [bacterium]